MRLSSQSINGFKKRVKSGLMQSQGFSLVEVMVASVLLAVLIVTFTNFFGWNVTSIFDTGQRTEAIAEAEKKLEKLHYSMDDYESDPEYTSPGTVLTYQNRSRNFCVEEESYAGGSIQGYKVTVVVFYKSGERQAAITSFIQGGL